MSSATRALIRVLRDERLSIMVPIICFAVVAWQHRWMSDDGFINARVVDQIFAGHGPVFNQGERVEAVTSPGWVAVLCIARLLTWGQVSLPVTAVGSGLLLTVTGLVAAAAAGAELRAALRLSGRLLPAGLLVLVAFPPMWDFASAGLETGLSFAWLGVAWWALARKLEVDSVVGRRSPSSPRWLPVLLGAGPLVRPDLVVFSVFFLVALVIASARGLRLALSAVGWASALPVAYQMFRMGYYGAVVPNTAIAKEAGMANWSQGWTYLADLVGPYHLELVGTLSVGLLLVAYPWRRWIAAGWTGPPAVLLAPVGAAVVHGLYIVRVGGDFMHARLLLPSLFGLALPIAVVTVPVAKLSRRAPAGTACAALVALVALWALVCASMFRVSKAAFAPNGIADERAYFVQSTGNPTPVTEADFSAMNLGHQGAAVRSLEQISADVLLDPTAGYWELQPRPDGSGLLVAHVQIGLVGYLAGPDVPVHDAKGLGDAVAARVLLTQRARPGHEKELPAPWRAARYGPVLPADAEVEAAREALRCGKLAEVLDATTAPLTLGRFFQNIVRAPQLTSVRFPSSPDAARSALCH